MLTAVKNDLQHATPESQGIASEAILKFVEAVESQIHELHSFMLLRHGNVVAEGWWSPYGREYRHMLFSLSKSFTSTAVGLAIAEGHFSLDDLVISFFPDEMPAEVNEHLRAMRVRHLLSMSTGHDVDTMETIGPRADGNWTKAFFEVPVVHEPGSYFLYNTGATYMLSAIVQKTTGIKLIDYLTPRLFEPLGITNVTWQESPQGINTGGFGLNAKTEDIARFGQLYLQKGMWQGKQIVPEAWVEEATSFQIDNSRNTNIDWKQGYGFQFWRSRHNAYRGDGAFGQYCIVMPEQDAVLAITSGLDDMQPPMNLLWDILLPAMTDEVLADDAAAQNTLKNKLSGLTIEPVQGAATSSIATRVTGRTYKLDANTLAFDTFVLKASEAGNTVTIKKYDVEETVIWGYGNWHKGETTLFNERGFAPPSAIVTSGAWTSDYTFTLVMRFYDTPFFQTFVCHFAGDALTIETIVNVGFEPPKTLVIAAHSLA